MNASANGIWTIKKIRIVPISKNNFSRRTGFLKNSLKSIEPKVLSELNINKMNINLTESGVINFIKII